MYYTVKSEKQTPAQQKWLKRVDEFIQDNINDQNLTVDKIAHAVFISERQFYRKIKKLTGKTPNQYLQILRLRKAKKMLEAGDYSSVKEVAFSVGYSRSDYFSRLYKSHFGVRPVTYF